MSNLQFRAILFDPADLNAERPIQIFGNDFQEIQRWAEVTVATAKAENAVVNVFQTIEQKIQVVRKKKESPRDEKGRCVKCAGTGRTGDGLYCECPLGADLRRIDSQGAARLRRAEEDATAKLKRLTEC